MKLARIPAELADKWKRVAVEAVTHPQDYTDKERAAAWRFLYAAKAGASSERGPA